MRIIEEIFAAFQEIREAVKQELGIKTPLQKAFDAIERMISMEEITKEQEQCLELLHYHVCLRNNKGKQRLGEIIAISFTQDEVENTMIECKHFDGTLWPNIVRLDEVEILNPPAWWTKKWEEEA